MVLASFFFFFAIIPNYQVSHYSSGTAELAYAQFLGKVLIVSDSREVSLQLKNGACGILYSRTMADLCQQAEDAGIDEIPFN